MDFLKSLVEFLGTYLAFMIIYYFATHHPKYIALAVGFAFGSVVFLFSKISADFNPVATLIFVLEKKQPVSDLITLDYLLFFFFVNFFFLPFFVFLYFFF
jgi:hypothetical protein